MKKNLQKKKPEKQQKKREKDVKPYEKKDYVSIVAENSKKDYLGSNVFSAKNVRTINNLMFSKGG